MARARTRPHRNVQNLDSLLDTMANVTGILVVLLAVTQISVGDAMERLRAQIETRPELTREALNLARTEALRMRDALAELVPRSGEFEARRRSGRDTLAALRTENSRTREQVDEASAIRNSPIDARIAEARQQNRALEDALGATREQIDSVQAKLAESGSAALRREVRVPDPRPPPANAEQIVYFVRYGRLFRIRTSELFNELHRGVREATAGSWAIGRPLPLTLDRARLVGYFRTNDFGSHALRWRVVDLAPERFQAQLEWRAENTGETLVEIGRGTSAFAQDLTRFDPKRAFFQFYVWDDSFDVYLKAREMANESGFSAGWDPRDRNGQIYLDLISPRGSVMID